MHYCEGRFGLCAYEILLWRNLITNSLRVSDVLLLRFFAVSYNPLL
jgi:hypothetical protein